MILALLLLVLAFCGTANAQVVSPFTLPPGNVASSSIPNGAPPQIVGYSAANTGESETVVGDMTFARTATNQYTSTVTKIGGTPVGALATLNAGAGLTATATTLSLTPPVTIGYGGTGTQTAPLAGQILIAQSATAYAPLTMLGDATITLGGLITVTKISGTTPGGVCSGGQFVSSISASGVPTCTTPSIAGVPSGTAPQMVGYTAGGAPESETVSGGAGGCSFTRTGANAYQMTCSTYAPTASPTFTGTVTLPTTSATQITASTSITVSGGGTFTGPDGGTWTNSGINDQIIKATNQFQFPDGATWTLVGANNVKGIGIGQAASGTDPLAITGTATNNATLVTVLNNNTGVNVSAGFKATNGTNIATLSMEGTAQSGGTPELTPNTAVLWSDQGIHLASHAGQQIQFLINNAIQGYFATNGLHLTAPLEIASGGTGTATAPAVGQALVATSTSAYAPTSLAHTNLSDYTAPTAFTPTLKAITGSNPTVTYSVQFGRYTRVGANIWWTVDVKWTAFTAGSGGASDVYISSPPVTLTQVSWGWTTQYYGISLPAAQSTLGCFLNPGLGPSGGIQLAGSGSNNTAGNSSLTGIGTAGELTCSGWGVTN